MAAILGRHYFTDAKSEASAIRLNLMWSTTYGVGALSCLMLTLALFGSGRAILGALLLGFGPAVHPAVGMDAAAAGREDGAIELFEIPR